MPSSRRSARCERTTWKMSPQRMCSFATSTRRSCSARSGSPDRRRRASGRAPAERRRGPASRRSTSLGSPYEHLGSAGTWSKRRKTSATTKRLSGTSGPVARQRDGRLELRDVVVAEVADDRLVEPLRLLERDEPVAAADERMPARAARARPTRAGTTHALSRAGAGTPRAASARSVSSVAVMCSSDTKKRPSRVVGWSGDGLFSALLRAQAPAPLAAPGPARRGGREAHRRPG